jgi:hypothetical protein
MANQVMDRFMKNLCTLTLITLLGCRTTDRPPKASPKPLDTIPLSWTVDKVDSGRLLFRNAPTIETHLHDLAYIGQVPIGKKAPLLILSGRDCAGCDENISLYMLSPSDGPLNVENGANRNKYPGTEKDYETGKWVYSSRVFYGQVLPDTNGVIWYESRLLDNDHQARDVYLSWIEHGIHKDTIFDRREDISQTLELCEKGRCKEIPGIQYNTEP